MDRNNGKLEKKYTLLNIISLNIVSFQDYLIRNFFLLRDIIYFLISNFKLSENIAIESRREISSGMHHVRSLFFSFFHLKSTRFTRGIKSVSLNIRSNRVISTWKQHSLHIVTQRNVNVNRQRVGLHGLSVQRDRVSFSVVTLRNTKIEGRNGSNRIFIFLLKLKQRYHCSREQFVFFPLRRSLPLEYKLENKF